MTPRSARIGKILGLLVVMHIGATPCLGAMQTTTTTYLYNDDGALTAVTTQVEEQTPTTVYLTWDNFVPDAADPTTGTVQSANGNLVGFGPTSGSALATQFQYDQRNRLTSAAAAGADSVTYAYYPASLMASSTLSSGDALQFYYDTASLPQVANINQSSTADWTSYLGTTTYLTDGTEQIRFRPRKDVAGLYTAATESFTPLQYDPYGAAASSTPATTATGYDLAQNPFQYGGEYQEAAWGGYYLRARWYLPEFQTFLGRDPADLMHRYSYTAGNPVGRADPSGLRGNVVEGGARTFLKSIDANQNGAAGSLSRIFLGWAIGMAQIVANPSGYWHGIEHDSHGIDIFLAAGIAVEVGTSGMSVFGLGRLPNLPGSYQASFAGRHAIDAVLGVGQSLAAGMSGHRRFDSAAFGQGLEYTVGGMLEGREAIGIGYKPFGLTVDDVDKEMATQRATAQDHNVLVYRLRYNGSKLAFTSPLLESMHIGNYHEAVFAVSGQGLWLGDTWAVDGGSSGPSFAPSEWRTRWSRQQVDILTPSNFLSGKTDKQLMFVGTYRQDAVNDAFLTKLNDDDKRFLKRNTSGTIMSSTRNYNKFLNNCQDSAARLRATIVDFQTD